MWYTENKAIHNLKAEDNMKHIKLIKAAIKVLFFTSAGYIPVCALAYIFSDKLSAEAILTYAACAMGLWAKVAALVLSGAAWLVCSAGLNKTGSARPFVCSQLLVVGVAVVFIGAWLSIFVFILTFIFTLDPPVWWDKLLFTLFYLPEVAVMALTTACMFVYNKENLAVSGENLPANPYAKRIRTLSLLKTAAVTVEAAAAVGYYIFLAAVALSM